MIFYIEIIQFKFPDESFEESFDKSGAMKYVFISCKP